MNSIAASMSDLRTLVTTIRHPVYWAGPRRNATYELTRTRDGRIYIRYLPLGARIGDRRPDYTAVGTYPVANAYDVVQAASRRTGAIAYHTRSGALVVVNSKTPTSVYFAFRGVPYLMEVFDPAPTRALQLVLSSQVRLIS
jgi:hypothetical protein